MIKDLSEEAKASEKGILTNTMFLAGHTELPQGMTAKTVHEDMVLTIRDRAEYPRDTASRLHAGNNVGKS